MGAKGEFAGASTPLRGARQEIERNRGPKKAHRVDGPRSMKTALKLAKLRHADRRRSANDATRPGEGSRIPSPQVGGVTERRCEEREILARKATGLEVRTPVTGSFYEAIDLFARLPSRKTEVS